MKFPFTVSNEIPDELATSIQTPEIAKIGKTFAWLLQITGFAWRKLTEIEIQRLGVTVRGEKVYQTERLSFGLKTFSASVRNSSATRLKQ